MLTPRPRPLQFVATRVRLSHWSRAYRVAGVLCAVAMLQSPLTFAASRPADRSYDPPALAARASLLAAASRMVEGTRDVALFALSLVGIDYRYGGETPDRGLDCSGLIRYVFQQVTGVTLPRTARGLSRIGKSIPARDLEPGDLVFFNTRHFPNSHVGIYLGDDRFIHAPSGGGEVGVATLSAQYWRKRYNGARRLAGVLPALVPALIAHAQASTLVDAPVPDDAMAPAVPPIDAQP
ncbi:MAG: C40 family peptidase [Casimicrobiaceae bacterium]